MELSCSLILSLGALALLPPASAFTANVLPVATPASSLALHPSITPKIERTSGLLRRVLVRTSNRIAMTSSSADISHGEYTYGTFKCAFLRKAAAKGFESSPPLLLVHPVGIGLSSWFWRKFLDEWEGGEVFAVDLIGCGNSSPWQPAGEGMFVPLDWVRSLETLWALHIRRKCVVVVQGGLAPVGVQLAARQTWEGEKPKTETAPLSVLLINPLPRTLLQAREIIYTRSQRQYIIHAR